GERVADEPVVDEPGELVETHGLRVARIDHRRIPRRRARDGAALLRRLGARGDPVGIRRRALRVGARTDAPERDGGHAGGGPAEEAATVDPGGSHPGSPFSANRGSSRRLYTARGGTSMRELIVKRLEDSEIVKFGPNAIYQPII